MAKKTGLGKGLDSLIPVHNNTEKEMAVVEKVVEKKTDTVLRITEIEPNKGQPRKNFNEDALEELADSIKQFGLIQPLVVQKRDGYYEIIAGERRWRAAKKAGLKEEDVFVSVDGTSVKGKSATEVANMLKSDSVKTSTIVVKRNDKELTFKVTKENITLFSVSSEMLDNNGKNVGYLSVSIFGQKTYSQFKDALTKLEKQDMDSLIIDLRGNTGGYLSTVTNMLEEFIDKGNVIYQIQSSSGVKQYKTVKASEKKYKIVVLIDGGSASASEIMSAAMKEVYGATLVGQTTYGKGTVQTTKNLSNGSMIKYTIEKWLTPSGKNIDKEGIKPDYELELGDSYKNNPTKENDAQLQKALDLLK